MANSMKKFVFALMLVGLSCSSSFGSIMYTSTHGVGTGSVSLSITTDGTLGVIGNSNILDWNIAMTDGPDSFTLLGPLSGSNSVALVAGSALTATASDLLFNFSAGPSEFLLIQSPFIGASKLFWSVQTSGSYNSTPGEAIDPRTDFTYVETPHSDNLVIASAGAAVPEPSSLTLVGLGAFGLVAGAIRRRRQQQAAV